jgi:hypothetical protein
MPLNWYSSIEKKIRKIWIIFDIENDFESQNFVIFDDFYSTDKS